MKKSLWGDASAVLEPAINCGVSFLHDPLKKILINARAVIEDKICIATPHFKSHISILKILTVKQIKPTQ